MRRSILVLMSGAVLVSLALGANAAPQGDDDAGWFGPGAMMGPGMMGDYGMGPHMICRGYDQEMMGGYGPMPMGREMMHGYRGYDMGRGMTGGFGMHERGGMFGRGMKRFGMFHALNLSDEQRDKIRHIMYAQRKEMWKQMGSMMDAREKMRDLFAEDQPDPRKVGAAYADISRVRQKMVEARVRTHNEIWNLLTNEQREQLKSWRHGHWGAGARGSGGNKSNGMMHK